MSATNGVAQKVPPTAGDLLIAAGALGWPAVDVAGHSIDASEAAWRAAAEQMDAAERLAFWHAWGAS
ncbi:MAG: hypothetical protein FJ027_04375 [Candidatus Rokubacteria bacterium]|nr:hypothetical protein [Candidatus Rokubacteria bacterium]